MNSTMSVTSGDFRRMAVAAADTLAVSSSVPPGGSSMTSCALEKSSGGTNEVGMIVKHATDRKKNTAPAAMVFQRFATHQRNSARYRVMIGPSVSCTATESLLRA